MVIVIEPCKIFKIEIKRDIIALARFNHKSLGEGCKASFFSDKLVLRAGEKELYDFSA